MSHLLVVPLVVLIACGGSAPPEAPPAPPAPVAPPAPPTPPAAPTATDPGYAIGVGKIVKLRAELQAELDGDRLADLHKTAEAITATAKLLPLTASDLPPEGQREVAAEAQKLQDLFGALDEAGDGGDKPAATKAVADYDAPIAALKKYVP
jgi:hypothetical protein